MERDPDELRQRLVVAEQERDAARANHAAIAVANARLVHDLDERNQELVEARERETATAAVLRVINRSPGKRDAALQAIADTAFRLCHADGARVWLVDGGDLVGGPTAGSAINPANFRPTDTRLSLSGSNRAPVLQAIRTVLTVHIEDLLQQAVEHGAPDDALAYIRRSGQRTVLTVPLVRNGTGIGVLAFVRLAVASFSPQEIALAEIFADQAVIAIENARLFDELEHRNHELSVSLERQTALTDVLAIINQSRGDVQPVLDAVCQRAQALANGIDVNVLLVRFEGLTRHTLALARSRDPHLFGQRPFGVWTAQPGQSSEARAEDLGMIAWRQGETLHVSGDRTEQEARYPGSTWW